MYACHSQQKQFSLVVLHNNAEGEEYKYLSQEHIVWHVLP